MADNKALIRRWFDEVWNQGREGTIEEMLAADGVVRGLGADLQGPEGFKAFHRAYRSALPDVTVRIEQVLAEGDMVAARWTAAGTHSGDGLGFPPTGRQVRLAGMTFARISNGQLVEGWNVFDQLGMLQQLGVVNLPE